MIVVHRIVLVPVLADKSEQSVSQARPRALSVPCTELRRQLHWLPVRQRISYKLAVITYKNNLTKTPTYLSDIIHEYHPTRTLRSADKLLLVVPRMPLTLSAKAFCVSAPSVWNSLSYNTVDLLNFSVLSSDF